jgi:TRAP-type C4-dicarboxylate transport system permease small subunit
MEKCKEMVLFAHASVTRICRLLERLSGQLILLMMALTSIDAAGRYLFNTPLMWSFEVTEMLMVAVVYLAMAYTDSQEGHINLDLLVNRMSPMGRQIMYTTTRTACLVFCIFLTWGTGRMAIRSFIQEEVTPSNAIPLGPAKTALAIGFLMICVELLTKILSRLVQLSDKRKAV